MPIIKPIKKLHNETLRLQCPTDLFSEIQNYCAAFHIEKPEAFFLQAAQYILEKDKDWKQLKKSPADLSASTSN